MAFVDDQGYELNVRLIENSVRQGKGFGATTGEIAIAASTNFGISLFNPAGSNKSIILYGLEMTADHDMLFGMMATITADTAWAAVTSLINKYRGHTNTSIASMRFIASAGAAPAAATVTDIITCPSKTFTQRSTEETFTLLPPGQGIEIWLPYGTSAGNAAVNLDWLEI